MPRSSTAIVATVLLAACSGQSSPNTQPAPSSVRVAETGTETSNKSTAARLGIPPGHLPPPGQCRVWIPGQPPGHQAKAGACSAVSRSAPAGSWIVYRPTADRKVVHVREVDAHKAGSVVNVRVFDAVSGAFLRSESP